MIAKDVGKRDLSSTLNTPKLAIDSRAKSKVRREAGLVLIDFEIAVVVFDFFVFEKGPAFRFGITLLVS